MSKVSSSGPAAPGGASVLVVLDASVLVSAIFGGIPAKAVSLALREEIVVSDEVMKELERVSADMVERVGPERATAWNGHYYPLFAGFRMVKVGQRVRICRDATDDAYLSLALAAGASYLVTGDEDLLTISRRSLADAGLAHLAIVTPREFVTHMRGRQDSPV
ncbi:MAG: putative toxin-antitoxin system toxin component, PIN family [Candidatus Coatesbacteria bacterium]